jgi:hypothetical protein
VLGQQNLSGSLVGPQGKVTGSSTQTKLTQASQVSAQSELVRQHSSPTRQALTPWAFGQQMEPAEQSV